MSTVIRSTESLRQVLISSRELEISQLGEEGKAGSTRI